MRGSIPVPEAGADGHLGGVSLAFLCLRMPPGKDLQQAGRSAMGGKNETQRVGGCVYTGLCSQPQGPGLDFSIGLSPAKVTKTRGNGAGKVEARTCYSKFRKVIHLGKGFSSIFCNRSTIFP